MQSIDEQIIPTKSHCGIRQYMPRKPKKWGIKVWRHCSISGIVYIEIYTGKGPNTLDEIPGIMLAGNAVYHLTKNLPYHQNFKSFFDISPL